MKLKHAAAQEQNAILAGQGKRTMQLYPYEFGLTVLEFADHRMELNIDVPKDSEMVYMPKLHDLSNAEAAALNILTYWGRNLNKRRELFATFGLGKLEKDSDSPVIRSLIDKGLMIMDAEHGRRNLRRFPRITQKGKAAAPDMERHDFVSNFKDVVLEEPNASFMHIKGIDEYIGD